MKHAVIIAHPNSSSLTHSAARAYVQAAEALGHQVIVRDLYAIGFDPRLQATEIPQGALPVPAEDVVDERRGLSDADVFAFIYPFWFNAPPAILKGYVDRVFSMGFGFEPLLGGGTSPLLDGRRLISFTFSGAPEQWVKDTGALRALTTLFDQHLSQMCGLRIVDHVHTGGIISNMTEEAVADVLAKVREKVSTSFGGASSSGEILV